jgi:hypothetical protein
MNYSGFDRTRVSGFDRTGCPVLIAPRQEIISEHGTSSVDMLGRITWIDNALVGTFKTRGASRLLRADDVQSHQDWYPGVLLKPRSVPVLGHSKVRTVCFSQISVQPSD